MFSISIENLIYYAYLNRVGRHTNHSIGGLKMSNATKRILSIFSAVSIAVAAFPLIAFGLDDEAIYTQESVTQVAETEATEPEPEANEPESTEPEVTEPAETEPVETEPEVTEPEIPEITALAYEVVDGYVTITDCADYTTAEEVQNDFTALEAMGLTVVKIDDNAFNYTYGLTSIVMPSTITEIGEYALQGCPDLTSITLNEGLVTVGTEAFADCPRLVSVNIPSTLIVVTNNTVS
jgi:hypothetical protein